MPRTRSMSRYEMLTLGTAALALVVALISAFGPYLLTKSDTTEESHKAAEKDYEHLRSEKVVDSKVSDAKRELATDIRALTDQTAKLDNRLARLETFIQMIKPQFIPKGEPLSLNTIKGQVYIVR